MNKKRPIMQIIDRIKNWMRGKSSIFIYRISEFLNMESREQSATKTEIT